MADAQLSEALASNQLVTFRWYAQQYGVPAEEAKATLQEYVDANDSLHAVYLLAGRVKGDNRVQYKLVEAAKLDEAKQAFESVTCHVYSVHAAKPSSGEAMWSLNHQQDRGLYAQLGRETNCLIDNRWSAVKCRQAVLRKGGRKQPQPAVADSPGPPKPAPKPVAPSDVFGSAGKA